MKTHLNALKRLTDSSTQNSSFVYIAGSNLFYKANDKINIVKLTSPVKIVWDKQYLNYDWLSAAKFVTKADTLVSYENNKATAKKLRAIFRKAFKAANLLQFTLTDVAVLEVDTIFSKNVALHIRAWFIAYYRGLKDYSAYYKPTAFTGKGKFRLVHKSQVKYKAGGYSTTAKSTKLQYSDTNNCGVIALAAAAGIKYDKAHKALAKQGRTHGKGIWMPMFEAAIKPYKNMAKTFDKWANKSYTMSVKQAIANKFITDKGIYVVAVTGHVYTIIDGVCHGHSSDAKKARARVSHIYKVTNK